MAELRSAQGRPGEARTLLEAQATTLREAGMAGHPLMERVSEALAGR